MSNHAFHPLSIRAIRQAFICLALFITFNPWAGYFHSNTRPADNTHNPPLTNSSSDSAVGNWMILPPLAKNPASGNVNIISSFPQLIDQPYSLDEWFQQSRITPRDPTSMMAFGYSVAIDSDTVVVGAYWHHHGTVYGVGSAYVFVKPTAGWPFLTQVAKLTASDGAFHDQFGWCVDVSGNTIVVGANNDDNSGFTSNGSVYVFVKPGSGWTDMTETAKLIASDAADSDEFGRRVSISGDTIAVGVPNDDIGTNVWQGSVYVFTKPAGGWINSTETAKLTASDGVAGDHLGAALAISGNTIVAGAYVHDHGQGLGEGQAYIFYQSGGWVSSTENARLTASQSFSHDYFGWSAAIDGDLVVVGAPGDYSWDGLGVPSVFVYLKPVGGWNGDLTEQAVLTASDGIFSDDFARSIDVSGDYIVAGAPMDDVGSQPDQGSAYVYSKPIAGWANMAETDKLTARDGVAGDFFGNSVSISGSTIVAGAHKNDITASNDDIGSAYIFDPQPVIVNQFFLPIAVR